MIDMVKFRQHQYGVECLGRDRYHVQYRINKKGAECFRTGDREEAYTRLADLSAKRPGIYTMQKRDTRLDRYGCEIRPLETIGWTNLTSRLY